MTQQAELRDALFDAIDDVQAGMLSLRGTDDFPQPMSPFLDRDTGRIWFISKTDTDFVRNLGAEAQAQFTLISKSAGVHAVLRGSIRRDDDRARLEELWSPVVEAWFEQGKDDPKIALLCLAPAEAAVWESRTNALTFGWEILKANVQDGARPDVGQFDILKFAA